MIRCVRLWSGPDGNSHFEEGAIDLESGPRGEVLSGRGMKLALDESRVSVEASVPPEAHKPGSALSVGIRPEHLTPGDGGLRLHVDASEVLGAEMIIHGVLRSGERLAVSLRGLHRVVPGESNRIRGRSRRCPRIRRNWSRLSPQRPCQGRNADLTVFEPSLLPRMTAVSARRSSQVATVDVAVDEETPSFCPLAP